VLGGGSAADSAAVEDLWDELCLARAGTSQASVADLEDAVFRLYLPLARALSHTVGDEGTAEQGWSEQAAELGLAHAVLAWRRPTSGGFPRFARSTIMRQLQGR